jgi:hypothetical protein
MKLDMNLTMTIRSALDEYERPLIPGERGGTRYSPSWVLPQACQRAVAIVASTALPTRQEVFQEQQMLAKEYHKIDGLSTL